MNTKELAYLTGVFDGEGSSYGPKGENRCSFGLAVKMTDLDILERFQQFFGGSITGPHAKDEAHHKETWTWTLTKTSEAVAASYMMWPLLGSRRRKQLEERILRWRNAPLYGKRRCGTYAGYAWHYRESEQPCVECKEAANEYTRNRRARGLK